MQSIRDGSGTTRAQAEMVGKVWDQVLGRLVVGAEGSVESVLEGFVVRQRKGGVGGEDGAGSER